MDDYSKPKIYRDFIDAMVEHCQSGSGSFVPDRIRGGAKDFHFQNIDNSQVKQLLKKLPQSEREIIAKMLEDAFESGVFETLKQLEASNITPFESGYEGSVHFDFIGRLNKDDPWEWPE